MAIVTTEQKWRARVEAWRASGLTSKAFCSDKGYTACGLLSWSSRLGRGLVRQAGEASMDCRTEAPSGEVRIVKVARPQGTEAAVQTPIVIEVGRARVSVSSGFDRETLRQVLDVVGEMQ